uniref:NADH dehydrogenase subunit 6 n=1 Tax=Vampyroteuthis infernalis TaxID=55288 RepID=A7BG43_9MOLL|nr:NADH dehydrogenase subunit 6 [Vampyroteuthis infernalis]BAF73646.1 NADH dehydrogenase subunit 6 [Vampyroteuthis infernalis]
MSLMLLSSLSFCISSISMMVIQPLSLGFMVMLLSIMSSMLISFIIFSWYGYLLFLIYIGGLLVMFMYVISLIPNLIFMSNKVIWVFSFFFFLFMLMNYFIMKSSDVYELKMLKYMSMDNIGLGNSGFIMLNNNFFCYMMMSIILLFVLISVVKICYYCEGPLRVFKFK